MLKITVPIVPKAQARDRIGVVNGRAMSYKSKDQKSAEQTLSTFLLRHIPSRPIDGPVMIGVRAYLPIPKSMPKYKRAMISSGDLRPLTKPDLDNLIKQVKDVMTQMRFWGDDKQVVGYLEGTGKYYSDNPRWEIEIREA